MAPSKAIATVEPNRFCAVVQSKCGSAGVGSPRGSEPKRDPMVSTRSSSAHTAKAESASTTMVLGSFAVTKRQLPGRAVGAGQTTIISRHDNPIVTATQLVVWMFSPSAAICEKEFDGIFAIERPRRSRTWESAMMIAMPVVNPITIEIGMNRIRVPSRNAPIAKRSTPAIIVAMRRLAMPYFSAIAYSRPTKAPAGPAICTREPPRSDTINPPTIAVAMPWSGRTPEAMPNAIASGSATSPTVTPAPMSAAKSALR